MYIAIGLALLPLVGLLFIYNSLVNSRMYIAISTTTDYFEPDRTQSLLDNAYIAHYLDQIKLFLGIVEDLGLNVRIWSKQ